MFREIIKKRLKEKGLKNKTICERLNIRPSSLSSYLNGKSGIHSESLEKLCDELNLILTPEMITMTFNINQKQ